MTAAAVVPLLNQQLRDLETKISRSESTGVLARWEFGHLLLGQRVGKQLPAGLLAQVAADLGVSRSELQKRMRFAEKYRTETEVRNALHTYGSWHRIVGEALPNNPKPSWPLNDTMAVLSSIASGSRRATGQGSAAYPRRLVITVKNSLGCGRHYLRDALAQLKDGEETMSASELDDLTGEVDKMGALVDRLRAELAKRRDSP